MNTSSVPLLVRVVLPKVGTALEFAGYIAVAITVYRYAISASIYYSSGLLRPDDIARRHRIWQ